VLEDGYVEAVALDAGTPAFAICYYDGDGLGGVFFDAEQAGHVEEDEEVVIPQDVFRFHSATEGLVD
jgi:hypothetical protein